jgi:hypothetical protein
LNPRRPAFSGCALRKTPFIFVSAVCDHMSSTANSDEIGGTHRAVGTGLTQRHTCALLREVACLSFGSTPKDRRGKAFGIKFSFRNTLPDGGSLAGYWVIAFRSRYELRPAGPLRAAFAVSASFKKFEGLLDSRPDSRLCRHLRSPATTKTNQDRRRIMSTRARYQFGCLTRRKRLSAALCTSGSNGRTWSCQSDLKNGN